MKYSLSEIHFHGPDSTTLTNAKFRTYDRGKLPFSIVLSGYEAAMLDLTAQKMNLKRFFKEEVND